MIVKRNQKTLWATIEMLLGTAVAQRVPSQRKQKGEKGHGRIEVRELVSSEILAEQTPFADLGQIFRLTRVRQEIKTGKRTEEVALGITSLSAREAGAGRLLGFTRGHWRIENRSHYVRDVTYGEDHSRVRDGNVAQVMAAIRNTAIGLLRVARKKNIAAATRYYAAHPWAALALLGLAPDF